MKKITSLCFFVFLITSVAQSQDLLRSTLGVSGSSAAVNDGSKTLIVQQSVGQESVIGTYNSGAVTLRQGFIQPPSIKISIIKEESDLLASVYPNPFTESVNISFSEEVSGKLDIVVHDMLGREVYHTVKNVSQEMTVNLQDLSTAQYIMTAVLGNRVFKATIIKK